MKLTVEFESIPREGEQENGDTVVVRHGPDLSLIGVLDALGHGTRAAAAAAVASRYLETAPLDRGLLHLVDGLHHSLRGTRGAAAMLLFLGRGRLEGCGVGNVEVRGHNTRVPAVLSPGILGAQLGRLKVFEAQLKGRGRLVLFSDGVSGRLALDDLGGLSPRDACRAIMDRHRRPGDDATVLVTDFED
ncbi:Anti-sigma B factor RsbT [Minicystis rosea]|nr:Anti-sigma B factor RsbT [Minicystis rosea]